MTSHSLSSKSGDNDIVIETIALHKSIILKSEASMLKD